MQDNNEKNGIYLSHIVKAKYSSENVHLHYCEYEVPPSDGSINNIMFCDAKNIQEQSVIANEKVTVKLSFDLLVIYEHTVNDSPPKGYNLYKDKVDKTLDISIKAFDILSPWNDPGRLIPKSILKNLKYIKDVDISGSKIIINIYASLESMLLEETELELPDVQKFTRGDLMDNSKIYKLPSLPSNIDNQDTLDNYIYQLDNLIKKSSEVNEKNKHMEEDIASKSSRISLLEYRVKQLEDECNRLESAVKKKAAEADDLVRRLEKSEKKVSILQNANLALDQEYKALFKETDDLKSYIEEEENKKKKQLNYRIKSAISNMKIF